MRNNRLKQLLPAGTVLVAVAGGVVLITIGGPLLTGAFRSGPPTGIRPAATTTMLAASPVSPIAPGTQVALTATITPAAAPGTVQFKDGASNLGAPVIVSNGTASGNISSLAPGSHFLAVVFTPANPATYSSSTSSAVVFTVTEPTVTTTMLATSPPSPAAQNTPVTLTATVTPATALGTVQFRDGATNLGNPVIVGNGVASGTTSELAIGPHQLTAVFTPTDPAAFVPSTSPPLAFVISVPATATATSTMLTTSPASPIALGTPVTLTATITPATAAGSVQFRDGTRNLGRRVPVSNGNASGTTSTLAVGSRSLNAVFIPTNSAVFSPSTSSPVVFVITPGAGGATATTTGLTTNPASPVRKGTQVVLNATVAPATAAGTVQFKDGATNLGNPVVVSSGTASSGTTSTLAAGGHQLTAVFTPADPAAFAASTSPVLAFEVTDRRLVDLGTCVKVLRDCLQPRDGALQPSQLDTASSNYPVAGRPNTTRFVSPPRRSSPTGSRSGPALASGTALRTTSVDRPVNRRGP